MKPADTNGRIAELERQVAELEKHTHAEFAIEDGLHPLPFSERLRRLELDLGVVEMPGEPFGTDAGVRVRWDLGDTLANAFRKIHALEAKIATLEKPLAVEMHVHEAPPPPPLAPEPKTDAEQLRELEATPDPVNG